MARASRQPAAPGPDASAAASHHLFLIDGRPLAYTVRRSARRRSITLVVDGDGLRVSAPPRAPQYRIEALLTAHAHWIARKLAEWQRCQPPRVAWRSGAQIMVLGEPVMLACDARGASAQRVANTLVLPLPAAADAAALHAATVAWLRADALRCFEQRAARYVETMAVPAPAIRLSNARTRWGSCHPDGRIRLNWRLIQMPLALLDYVVVHELAHLHVPDHTPRFWRVVERVLPDYRVRRLALRRDSHRYLVA